MLPECCIVLLQLNKHAQPEFTATTNALVIVLYFYMERLTEVGLNTLLE